MSTEGKRGILYVVATPIGNLEDVTLRAIRVLREADLIAAEDTRQTRKLLDAHSVPTPLTSLHEHNEERKSASLVARLAAGDRIAYVSDAGTPGISDPGYRLIRAAIDAGIPVSPIPGASAVVAALSASGLPMDRFVFYGFLPSRAARRRQMLDSLRGETATLVFYESPNRLIETLRDLADGLGERPVVVCRELTKVHEEILRGTAEDLIRGFAGKAVRGEVTLIVGGAGRKEAVFSDETIEGRLRELGKETGLSQRDRIDRAAREMGLPRKRVYDLTFKKRA